MIWRTRWHTPTKNFQEYPSGSFSLPPLIPVLFVILLAPVVQKLDSAIQWISQLVSIILIHRIAIYLVDSTIQLMNNRGLASTPWYLRPALMGTVHHRDGDVILQRSKILRLSPLHYSLNFGAPPPPLPRLLMGMA